jgi:hypothetical protein
MKQKKKSSQAISKYQKLLKINKISIALLDIRLTRLWFRLNVFVSLFKEIVNWKDRAVLKLFSLLLEAKRFFHDCYLNGVQEPASSALIQTFKKYEELFSESLL